MIYPELFKSCTHQDGQHDILEVIPKVGGVSAEEHKVALYQLQKSETFKQSIFSCVSCLLLLSTQHTVLSAN